MLAFCSPALPLFCHPVKALQGLIPAALSCMHSKANLTTALYFSSEYFLVIPACFDSNLVASCHIICIAVLVGL